MKFFSLIWSNLKRKKLRTSLTLLSILVAFLLYGLLCTVKEAFTAGIKMAGADRLIVRHKVSLIMPLPITYGRRMEQVPGVASTVHVTWFNGIQRLLRDFPNRSRTSARNLSGDPGARRSETGMAQNAQWGGGRAQPNQTFSLENRRSHLAGFTHLAAQRRRSLGL